MLNFDIQIFQWKLKSVFPRLYESIHLKKKVFLLSKQISLAFVMSRDAFLI